MCAEAVLSHQHVQQRSLRPRLRARLQVPQHHAIVSGSCGTHSPLSPQDMCKELNFNVWFDQSPIMCSGSTSIIQAQKLVDQLRVEANMERFKISLTAASLVRYCQEHRRSDPLLTGIAASSNPFKDKKTCVLL
uniref:Guanine nucleotide-binding protein subunit gamma n=1 Tax=Salarias fasciatus TaxID=181472 RepID=A0A672G9N3_SALFA